MYTPNSIDVFCAAYAGAIGGYQKGRSPSSTITSQYIRVAEAALAFAIQFDTEFAVVLPNELQLQEIETLSAEIMTYPNNSTTAITPTTYAPLCDAIIAMMSEASSVVAANIPTPIPIPTPISQAVLNLSTVVGPGLYGTIPVSAVAAVVDGYHIIGDGGGGLFFWNPTSSATDNTGTIINPSGHVGNGRWIRIYSGAVNVNWFGAFANGVLDNLVYVTAALLAIPVTGGGLQFGAGVYKMSDELVISGYDHLKIFSDEGGAILQTKNKRGFSPLNCTNLEICGMTLKGTIQTDGGDPGGGNEGQTGLFLTGCTGVKIHHNNFVNLGGYGVNPSIANTDIDVHHNRFDQTMAGCQTGGGVGVVNTNLKVTDNTFIGFIPTGGAGTIGSDDLTGFFGGLSGLIMCCRNFYDKRGVDAPSKALVQGHCISVESAGVGGNVRDILINENECVNCASTVARGRSAIEILADPGGIPSHMHVNGNIIRTANSGIVINAGGGAYTMTDLTVDENDISDIQLGVTIVPYGIAIDAPAGGGPTVSRISVCRNNVDTVADASGAGIVTSVTVVNVGKFNGNIIKGVIGQGLFLDTAGSQWDVEQNDVNGSGANGIVVISTGGGGRVRLIGNHSESNGAEGFNLQSLVDVTALGNISKSNGADGFYVQSVTGIGMMGNIASLNAADGLKTVTLVNGLRCIGNDFHNNTGYGVNYGGTNNVANFIGNDLKNNTTGAFNDASVTSTTFYLDNPDTLKSIAKAGILAPTAGESPVVTPAGIWLNAGIHTGADLADADATITATVGNLRWMRATTMSANRSITLGTGGAPAPVIGEVIGIVDLDTTNHTLTIINGGPAAGTLIILPGNAHRAAYCRFNGTDWELANVQSVVTDA